MLAAMKRKKETRKKKEKRGEKEVMSRLPQCQTFSELSSDPSSVPGLHIVIHCHLVREKQNGKRRKRVSGEKYKKV